MLSPSDKASASISLSDRTIRPRPNKPRREGVVAFCSLAVSRIDLHTANSSELKSTHYEISGTPLTCMALKLTRYFLPLAWSWCGEFRADWGGNAENSRNLA
jgi:hypothetical protein